MEIACGLEALAEGIRISGCEFSQSSDETDVAKELWRNVLAAVRFLKAVQDQDASPATDSSTPSNGGLGFAIDVSEQRLDVTGHAVNALTKVYDLLGTSGHEHGSVSAS